MCKQERKKDANATEEIFPFQRPISFYGHVHTQLVVKNSHLEPIHCNHYRVVLPATTNGADLKDKRNTILVLHYRSMD